MTRTAQDIIAGVEVLTTRGATDKRGQTQMAVFVGESGAMSIMDALDAAGYSWAGRRNRPQARQHGRTDLGAAGSTLLDAT